MGDFLHAILQLAGCLNRDEIFIVRQREPDDIEAKVFAKLDGIGVKARAIRSYEKNAAMQVMRALRKGAIVVALFDLPESYGSGTTVRFCGHELKWVGAPALLVQRAKSILLPFVSFRSPDGAYHCDVLEAYDFSNVSLSVPNGSFVALFRPSGIRKTTLLNVLKGLLDPESGQLEIDGITSVGLVSTRSACLSVYH
jgi:ABC-type multidrug transport system fused ATPase/permease subunit